MKNTKIENFKESYANHLVSFEQTLDTSHVVREDNFEFAREKMGASLKEEFKDIDFRQKKLKEFRRLESKFRQVLSKLNYSTYYSGIGFVEHGPYISSKEISNMSKIDLKRQLKTVKRYWKAINSFKVSIIKYRQYLPEDEYVEDCEEECSESYEKDSEEISEPVSEVDEEIVSDDSINTSELVEDSLDSDEIDYIETDEVVEDSLESEETDYIETEEERKKRVEEFLLNQKCEDDKKS